MRKKIVKKCLVYACVGALTIANLPAASLPVAQVSAAETLGEEVSLQLGQDGVDKTGPQHVTGDYAYQGVFSIPEGVTADYKFLEITYVGDISSLRLQGSSTTWFAENAEGTFKTADGSAIVLNAETETTVVIDLEKTGVSYVGGDTIHVHAGNGTDFTYEFKSIKLKTTAESKPPVVESKSVSLQLGQDGVDKTGPQSVSGDYAYQGVFSIPEGVTEDYKFLEITYVGDISSLRLQGSSTTWFAENAEGTFKTADGSDIVLNATEPTTVVIDLEKTGVSYVGGDTIHVHAGNGTDFTYEFKSVKLKTTAEPEAPVVEGKSVALQLGQDGVDKTGPQSVSGAYAYQGGFSIPEGVTEDYKFLEITYVGDISSLRLQGNSETWFAENPAGTFKTVDGSDIVLNATEPTTVVIDLEKTGVSYVAGDFIHLHAGNGTDFTYEFKGVYLKTTPTASTEEPSTPEVTTPEVTTPEVTTPEVTTPADPSTGIKLDDAASGMNKTLHIDKAAPGAADGIQYKYLGFVTFKDLANKDFKYLQFTYTGDITNLRFEFNEKGTDANQGAFWFDPEQEIHFVTKDGSPIQLVGNNTTVVIDLAASGVDMSKYNNGIHMHGNSTTDAAFDVTIKDAVLFGGVPTPQETTAPQKQTTKAPTVKAPAKTKVKSASKKKSAKKVKISLKKVKGAKGYYVQISKTKKFKKVLVKKYVKKAKFTIKSKKLKNKKKLYVRAKAYKLNGKKKVLSKKWSKAKKMKIKK